MRFPDTGSETSDNPPRNVASITARRAPGWAILALPDPEGLPQVGHVKRGLRHIGIEEAHDI